MTLRTHRRLAVTSSLAIATALLVGRAPEARAQSFQGTGTVVAGSASIVTGSGTTDITIGTPSAVINWTANDTATSTSPIIWQPSGTTATFTNSVATGVTNYSVLNRILPVDTTRQIQFDGHVISQIQSAAGGTTTGGTVYFYSPGGILVGGGVFDVGNLGLTSSPVSYNAATGDFDTTGTVSFQPANAGSRVDVLSGGQINASGYVALVSPVVTNAGSISIANGGGLPQAVAMVAANAADITFSPDGLFDITVTQGTAANGNVLTNSGFLGGTGAGSPGTFSNRAYLVAVPQNQAITMAIAAGGQIGFNPANAADVVGNTVILSAGTNVVAGEAGTVASPGGGTGLASISGGDTQFRSAVRGRATGGSALSATTATLRFESDANILTMGGDNTITANGATVFVGNDLTLGSEARGTDPAVATTGFVSRVLAANSSVVQVQNNATVFSDAYGADANGIGISGGAATGGTASMEAASAGRIQVGGDGAVYTRGFGGTGVNAGAGGGAGTGGSASVITTGAGNSQISFNRTLLVSADGFGGAGNGCVTCTTDGGLGTGGTVQYSTGTGGVFHSASSGATTLSARGTGGSGTGAAAGDGQGGTITFGALNRAALTVFGTVDLDASGIGGGHTASGAAGKGTGGALTIASTQSSNLDIRTVTASAAGLGGNSFSGDGGRGFGGSASMTLDAGQFTITGDVNIGAAGIGGTGGNSGNGGFGGDAGGGVVNITSGGFNGSLSNTIAISGRLDAQAYAQGGDGNAGGGSAITSGQIFLTANTNTAITTGAIANFNSGSFGGTVTGVTGVGGDGNAGSVIVAANGGRVTFGDLAFLYAHGAGGASIGSGASGNGLGGVVEANATNGGVLQWAGGELNSSGFGGDGVLGGTGRGGQSRLIINGGSSTTTVNVQLTSNGTGGTAGDSPQNDGGLGAGGSSLLSVQNGSFTAPSVLVYAQGYGGTAFGAQTGGAGQGGSAEVDALAGGIITATGGLSIIDSTGAAGTGFDPGGNAGDSFGGGAVLNADGGSIHFSDVTVSANGSGALGYVNGGRGQGGNSTVSIANAGGVVVDGVVTVAATGNGAEGGTIGGIGGGGTAAINITGGSLNTTRFDVVATGTGGNYSTDLVSGNGALGGGGTARVTLNAAASQTATLQATGLATVNANGTGGGGVASGNGFGGTANVDIINGSATLGSQLLVSANGLGGSTTALVTSAGGQGRGGSARVNVFNNSSFAGTGTTISAYAIGGDGQGGANAGDALGGAADLQVSLGGSMTQGGADITVESYTRGGNANAAGGTAGNANGGGASITVNTGSITNTNNMYADASAAGGTGVDRGGDATAGQARVGYIGSSTVVTLAGDLGIASWGLGGAGLAGGNGTGTFAQLTSTGGTMTVRRAIIHGWGAGGNTSSRNGGSGGIGTGGNASVFLNATGAPVLLTATQGINTDAHGLGGDGGNGAAGNGGVVRIESRGGDINTGYFDLDATALGGRGIGTTPAATGGAATGGLAELLVGTAFAPARGSVFNVSSTINMDVSATGGAGFVGGAANAGSAGTLNIFASQGTLNATGGLTTLSAKATGGAGNTFGVSGYGSASPTGGAATGGTLTIFAQSNAAGSSAINLGNVTADASGTGGLGGSGLSNGDRGGNGGAGTGGRLSITSAAGNGRLTAGNITATASGSGGNGGAGFGANAAGGNGGIGTGGGVIAGLQSGLAVSSNTGSATYASLNLTGNGAGGSGGSGGVAAGADGQGGNGGDGFGGSVVLQTRGAPVTVTGTTDMNAQGFGGNATSSSSLVGNGGNAIAGTGGVLVTNLFQVPTQRGQMTTGDIAVTTSATGGTGTVNGTATVSNDALIFNVTNADATISNLTMNASGTSVAPAATPSLITLTGGAVSVPGALTLNTAGDVTLALDGATLSTGVLQVNARNWLLGAVPVSAGTVTLGSGGSLGTTQDIVTYANFVIPFNAGLSVPGALQFGNLNVTGNFTASAGTSITLGNVTTTGNLSLDAGTTLAVQGLSSGGFLHLGAGSGLSTGGLTANEYVDLFSSGGAITVGGDINAGDYVTVDANGVVSIGNIHAGTLITSGNPSAKYQVLVSGQGDVGVGLVHAQNGVGLFANGGSLTTGAVRGSDLLLLGSNGVHATGLVNPTGRVLVGNASMAGIGGSLATYDFNAVFGVAGPAPVAGPVQFDAAVTSGSFRAATSGNFSAAAGLSGTNGVIVSAGGTLGAAGTVAGGPVNLNATGVLTFGTINSTGGALVNSQTSISGGNVNAVDRVLIASNGNVTLGNVVSSPTVFGSPLPSIANTVHIGSGGTLTVGNIRSNQSTTLVAGQDITVGQINSRLDIALLPTGSLTTGSLLAGIVVDPATGQLTGANGRILIGKSTMLQGAGTLANLDYNALFNAAPVAINGSVLDNGGGAAFYLRSYSNGSFSAGGIRTFHDIAVESGGLVTVRQQWASPDIEIRSTDIDIQQPAPLPTNPNPPAGLNAGTTGSVRLISTGSSPALIGDGLTGTGYSLSQAEFSRINSGTVLIGAIDQSANPIDMLIGNLAMTGPLAGSTIDDPNGRVIFATGTINASGGGTPSGGIRITGNLVGTGFTSTNVLEFDSDLFELDAGTGSITLSGTAPSALSGIIEITAKNIHIADMALLTKLEADPLYVGHIADLNRPATVQRPGGVFNAGGFDIFPGQTFYIQNTGTVATPAGFLVGPNTDVTPPTTPPTGGIEVVVNGQFVTANGTLTGKAAYDALLASQPDFTGFSSQSQLNSCLFIGGCQSAEDPLPGISSEIAVLTDGGDLSDSPVVADEPDEGGDQQEKSDEEKAAEAAAEGSPIVPPAPLIDTRPLNPPTTVTEPVAGSGNPALIGSAVNEGTAQGDAQ